MRGSEFDLERQKHEPRRGFIGTGFLRVTTCPSWNDLQTDLVPHGFTLTRPGFEGVQCQRLLESEGKPTQWDPASTTLISPPPEKSRYGTRTSNFATYAQSRRSGATSGIPQSQEFPGQNGWCCSHRWRDWFIPSARFSCHESRGGDSPARWLGELSRSQGLCVAGCGRHQGFSGPGSSAHDQRR